ncbi:MAG TPA: chemotaxis protein CheA [Candidatus Limnocylindrales bacterium]
MHLTFDLQPGDDRLFTDESMEQIERIEQGLLDLEHDLDTGVVNEVFRAAHTLKGSAATIGHRRMTELTHAMEDLFGAFRSGTLHDVKPFADVLLATIDVLRALVTEVQEGETLTEAAEPLTKQLRELLSSATAAAAARSSIPKPAARPTALPAPGDDAVDDAIGAAAEEAAGEIAAAEEGVSNIAVAPLIHRLLTESPGGYEPRSIFVCRIDPMSEWQSVRLLQLVLEADESGGLVASVPDRTEIESGLGTTLLAMLVKGRPVELLDLRKHLAAIDDVVGVEAVAAPLGSGSTESTVVPLSVDVYGPEDSTAPLGAARTDDENAAGPPGPSERRQADLGAEARGLPQGERMAVAGDRLKAAQQTIRIDVSRLDELMNLVGELVVHKTRLAQSAQLLTVRLGDDPLARQADEDSQQFARIAGQLQDQVTGLRMLPIETVFNRFPRVVRDIAMRLSKEIQLVIEGKETELDRSVLEEVGDPLGHLVRNALDHGIETPDERRAVGKPAQGTVRLTARHADGRILITVEDDGRGMAPDAMRRAAVDKGLMTKEAADLTSDAEILRVIFMPGFSTAKVVTEVSGRGVGMDVVRNNIEHLGGWVDVSSTPGQGTRVSLSLPLTLAIIGALLVKSGTRVCALPLTGVVETLRVEEKSFARVRGHNVLTLRDRVIPVERLDNALGDPPRRLQSSDRGFINLVVVRSRGTEMALAVDEFVGQHEIVLKSLSEVTGERAGLAGATVMADGAVGLVVDIAALLDHSASRATPPDGGRAEVDEDAAPPKQKRKVA